MNYIIKLYYKYYIITQIIGSVIIYVGKNVLDPKKCNRFSNKIGNPLDNP